MWPYSPPSPLMSVSMWRGEVHGCFINLLSFFYRHKFPLNILFNVDETGVTTVQGPEQGEVYEDMKMMFPSHPLTRAIRLWELWGWAKPTEQQGSVRWLLLKPNTEATESWRVMKSVQDALKHWQWETLLCLQGKSWGTFFSDALKMWPQTEKAGGAACTQQHLTFPSSLQIWNVE